MSTCAISRGRAMGSASGEPDLGGNARQRVDHEDDVRIELDAEFRGAPIDVVAVHRPCKRLVLELFAHGGRLQAGHDFPGTHERARVGSAGSATCRWISWRRPSRPRAAGTESAARWRGRPARSCRWPGTATPRRCSARPSGSDSRALLLVDRLAQRLDVCFEHPNPLHQLLERFRDRIREIRLIQVDVADALAVLVCYSAGNADDNAVRRNFADDDGAGADPAVVADRERAEHLGAGADDDVVAERRVTLLLPEARSAQRHPLQERDVLADFGRLADDDAHPVIDEQTGPDSRGWMNLDPGQEPPEVGDAARESGEAPMPEPMRDAMKRERVDAGIAQQNFGGGARRRIALQHGADVAAQGSEHHAPRRRRASRAAARTAPATTSAACLRSSGSPSSASSTSRAFKFTRSSTMRPAISSLAALAAAIVGPHP